MRDVRICTKKGNYETVVFVDATPKGVIVKTFSKIERSGSSIKSHLVKSNPFARDTCNGKVRISRYFRWRKCWLQGLWSFLPCQVHGDGQRNETLQKLSGKHRGVQGNVSRIIYQNTRPRWLNMFSGSIIETITMEFSKILSDENFCPSKILFDEFLSDKVYVNARHSPLIGIRSCPHRGRLPQS